MQQPVSFASPTRLPSRVAHHTHFATPHRGAGAGLSAMAAPRLQGVDLRLDNFDLSSATRVSTEAQVGSWGCDVTTLDKCTDIGSAFWTCIDSSKKVFNEDDQTLLKDIFHSELSDRRMEGDCFVPPDASQSYVTKLKELVKEEQSIRQRRKEQFFSKAFVMSDPGVLFPGSWKASFEIARGNTGTHAPEDRPEGVLVPRPEYVGEVAELLKSMLKASAPIFDKRTEEGLRFRIYRLGSLEVRATQEVGRDMEVGAVFSVRAWTAGSESLRKCSPQEKIGKATKYVERAPGSACRGKCGAKRQYFLVVETEPGHKIVMESLSDGTATWEEDPEDLEDRISLAKVIGSRKSKEDVLVQDLQKYRAAVCKQASRGGTSSPSSRKRFVYNAFAFAMGTEVESDAVSVSHVKTNSSAQSLWWMAPPSKRRDEDRTSADDVDQ